mmetsp:Transcript_4802/g.8275  ORF Transcript_4802/g.8275 Transcript_4802/m.8275 type:complete len:394 (+) Transcript_4802:94-1275(+)
MTFKKADRLEAQYEGEWYPATVIEEPSEANENKWIVHCDVDEEHCLTATPYVRPLRSTGPLQGDGAGFVPSEECKKEWSSCFPPDAYLDLQNGFDGKIPEVNMEFFKQNGFLLLDNAVPAEAAARARDIVTEAEQTLGTNGPNITSDIMEETGIWSVVEALVGNPMLAHTAQVPHVALTPDRVVDDTYYPNDLHIDGVHDDGSISNFTLLVGVPLDEFPEPCMGNFGVFPGSHLQLQELFKKEGIDIFAKWKAAEPPEALTRQVFSQRLRNLMTAAGSKHQPLYIHSGQAFIAHYQMLHFVHPNLRGADPRRVMYFRVYANRQDPKDCPAALTDVWHELPPVVGRPVEKIDGPLVRVVQRTCEKVVWVDENGKPIPPHMWEELGLLIEGQEQG